MSKVDEVHRRWALEEARRMLAEGYLFPSDYVMLDGEQIAYVDAAGELRESPPLAKPGVP